VKDQRFTALGMSDCLLKSAVYTTSTVILKTNYLSGHNGFLRMCKFRVFRRIAVGGLSKEQLIESLVKSGVRFNKYAETLFAHASFSPSPIVESLSLVKVKQSDLALNKQSTYSEITKQALSLGLKLCPIYLGAFLRLEYLDQAAGPYLTIASQKLEDTESFPNGFYVRNLDNCLWLRGYRASDDYKWPLDHEFIFLK